MFNSSAVAPLGWGDSQDAARAFHLDLWSLRYLPEDQYKKWLHENWRVWQRTNPQWFTKEFVKRLGERQGKDLPPDFLPPRALAQIKAIHVEEERGPSGADQPERIQSAGDQFERTQMQN